MKAKLNLLSGSRAGATFVFSQNTVAIGRHPDSDLQFDPNEDLDVSVRHAALVRHGERWMIRDLDSRNGTLVNGHRIHADTILDDTDQIRLGPEGPSVEFRLVAESTPDTAAQEPLMPAPARPIAPAVPSAKPAAAKPKASTTQRVRVAVTRQTRRHRRVTGGLAALLVLVVGGFVYINRQQQLAQDQEVARLRAQIDSVLLDASETVTALQGEMADLANTLDSSQQLVRSLRGRLDQARETGNDANVETLSAELRDALLALAERQHAARIDFQAITRANQRAVAMIFVEFGPGQMETGTAFAVRTDGTMLTTRHTVAGPGGNRVARRIGIRFADSRQTFPARLVAMSRDEDTDLAVIRVSLRGEVPTVRGFNQRTDPIRVGAPIAVIGFPGGADSPQRVSPDGTYATPSLTAGTVSKTLPELLQINGYGSPGASGSPIFDADGLVVGVLFGGEAGSGGRIVYAVPVAKAADLLRTIN